MGLIENIQSGKYDDHLDRIIRACQTRKEDRVWNLGPGDRVKFGQLVRPDYLRGATGTIIQWRRTRVLVQLDLDGQYLGKFIRGGGKIIANPGSLMPVSGEEANIKKATP